MAALGSEHFFDVCLDIFEELAEEPPPSEEPLCVMEAAVQKRVQQAIRVLQPQLGGGGIDHRQIRLLKNIEVTYLPTRRRIVAHALQQSRTLHVGIYRQLQLAVTTELRLDSTKKNYEEQLRGMRLGNQLLKTLHRGALCHLNDLRCQHLPSADLKGLKSQVGTIYKYVRLLLDQKYDLLKVKREGPTELWKRYGIRAPSAFPKEGSVFALAFRNKSYMKIKVLMETFDARVGFFAKGFSGESPEEKVSLDLECLELFTDEIVEIKARGDFLDPNGWGELLTFLERHKLIIMSELCEKYVEASFAPVLKSIAEECSVFLKHLNRDAAALIQGIQSCQDILGAPCSVKTWPAIVDSGCSGYRIRVNNMMEYEGLKEFVEFELNRLDALLRNVVDRAVLALRECQHILRLSVSLESIRVPFPKNVSIGIT